MMTSISSLGELSDKEVLRRVCEAARDERFATARLISLLMELDARRLYLGEGCSSLFTSSYNRIETARAARRFPIILELVESAVVTLTTVRLLAPHLTDANHREVLERARHAGRTTNTRRNCGSGQCRGRRYEKRALSLGRRLNSFRNELGARKHPARRAA